MTAVKLVRAFHTDLAELHVTVEHHAWSLSNGFPATPKHYWPRRSNHSVLNQNGPRKSGACRRSGWEMDALQSDLNSVEASNGDADFIS
jgi:hypothetical protein